MKEISDSGRARLLLLSLLLVGLIPTACGSGSSSPPSARPSTTTNPPVTLAALRIKVTPSTDLRNGQVVQVAVSGFPPGKAFLSECASPANVNAEGCGSQLALQPFVVIEGGSGTSPFTVTNTATSAPLSSGPTTICTTCVIVATTGAGNGPQGGGFILSPITFAS